MVIDTRNLQTYLFFIILGGLVAWVIFGREKTTVDVHKYTTTIDSLQVRIDSTLHHNHKLADQIYLLENDVENANKKIKQLNGRIWTIKKETDEKLNSIDTLNNSELYKFFADRYRYHLDSISGTSSKTSN